MVIILAAAVIIIGAAVIIPLVRSAGRANAHSPPVQTILLEKTDIARTVSVSGVVESASVTNIYSTQSYPVREIYVKVGDAVSEGEILAILDMSRLENDIAQAEINLKNAIASASEEVRSNSNSVANARISLESSEISLSRQRLSVSSAERDLRDAERRASEEFDSYTYDNSIEDARLNMERRTSDLEKAQADLADAIEDFDEYTYQNAINDTGIALERRRNDLAEAEKTLGEVTDGTAHSLTSYKNAVSDAELNLTRKRSDHTSAQNDYYYAMDDYYAACSAPGANDQSISSAWSRVLSAEKAVTAAARAIDDAGTALNRAKADLQRAEENTLDSAKDSLTNAANAFNDAQRSYDRAVSDLERARSNAVDSATDKLTSAQNAYNDAERAYEKALQDKIRAIDNHSDSSTTGLANAQRAYQDSLRQLESSQNNVISAQNSLEQAEGRGESQGSNVEIQELNLRRLTTQLAECYVYATAGGVITEINAKVGAAPGGIMFVIEDTEDLYVSARVREHSVSSVLTGQGAVITTDATGDREYDGIVTFISPRAVSAAGSTSVEFEVRAGLLRPDPGVRIGMNAFLNIIVEEKPGVYAVLNSVIVTNENGSFVYADENGERREIAVTLGIRTMVNSEISGEGLHDGMQLIIDPEGLLSSVNDQGFPAMFGRR